MALLIPNSSDTGGQENDFASQERQRWFRRRASSTDASERTLVSPMMMQRPGGRLIYWLVFALLLISTLITLGPVYWMFSSALKSSIEIFRTPPTFWPLHPLWSNYSNAWNVMDFPLYFGNTLILAVGAVVLQLVVSATAAYSLSKLRPTGKGIIQFCIFCTLMVPPVAYLIPQFVNVSNLSLNNNWGGVLLPEAASAFNILILKSFFDAIPAELTDAARLDGANAWHLFTRIIMPLSRPVLSVVTIFTVIASWKDFLWPLLVLTDNNLQPLGVAIYRQAGINSNFPMPFTYLMAGLALASIPPIVLFLIFQRQIIRGISLTGLKG